MTERESNDKASLISRRDFFYVGAVVGVIADEIFRSPLRSFTDHYTKPFIDEYLDRREIQSMIISALRSGISRDRTFTSVGTDLTDLHLPNEFADSDIGEDDRSVINDVIDKFKLERMREKRLNVVRGDMIAAGGRYTNRAIADIFKKYSDDKRIFYRKSGKFIELEASFCKVGGQPIHRQLKNIEFSEEHISVRLKNSQILQSSLDIEGKPENGYLVITKFPHPESAENMILHIGGNTGPATEAARLLLEGRISKLDALKFTTVFNEFTACQAIFRTHGRDKENEARLGRCAFKNIELHGDPVGLHFKQIPREHMGSGMRRRPAGSRSL